MLFFALFSTPSDIFLAILMMDASGNGKAVAVLTGKGAALPENMRFYSYQKFHYVILRTSGRTALDSATMLSMY